MKIRLHPKLRVQFLFLIFAFGLYSPLFSQSNPADIFSGRVVNILDDPSEYWIGNSQFKIKSLSIGHDNDLFGLAAGSLNKDESYTGGFQLQLTLTPILEKFFFRFTMESKFSGTGRENDYPRIDTSKCAYINNVSKFELGAQAYTPFDLESTAIVEEDRPYGSFHYLSIGLNSSMLKKKSEIGAKEKFMHRTIDSQFYLGTIGGYAAPVFQSFTHRFLKRETPNGWHNQVSGSKRRIALNYRLTNRFLWDQSKIKTKEITRKDSSATYRTTIIASVHTIADFNIGNYATNLGMGLRLHLFEINRGARFNTELPGSQNNFTKNLYSEKDTIIQSDGIDIIIQKEPESKLADNWSFYIYGQVLARAIIFDSMLQGTLFNDQSVHTIDYRQMNPFRIDMSLGFALGFTRKLSLFVDADYRTQEFLGGKKLHLFSRIGLNFNLE